ncbi:MAG: cell division protein FtsL [Candidatus Riflebacteria bacterium]|nr:cell division protein FtsL [Candidatus Riflebacteria bacterium]
MNRKVSVMLPAEAEIRVTPREEVTQEDIARRRHIIRLYLTAILLLSAMLTVYIWQSTKMVEIKLRIKNLNKTIENLESSNEDIKAETTKLEAIDLIAQKAKKELGMVEPGKPLYIKLPPNWKNIYDK